MKRKFYNIILLIAAWLQIFTGCAYQTTYTYKTEAIVEKPSGIYVGATSFANGTQNITGEKPVFLNEEGGLFLTRAIINRYKTSDYQNISQSEAVEQAVSAINSHSEYFPNDLESVDIVVISDKESSKNPSPPEIKAVGKNVNVHYFNANKEIDEISGVAVKFTETFGKSSAVYILLDAAPENEFNAVKIQFSAVAILEALSKKVDIAAPTPLVKVFIDEKNPKTATTIDGNKTLAYWLATVVTGVIVVLIIVFAVNAESSE